MAKRLPFHSFLPKYGYRLRNIRSKESQVYHQWLPRLETAYNGQSYGIDQYLLCLVKKFRYPHFLIPLEMLFVGVRSCCGCFHRTERDAPNAEGQNSRGFFYGDPAAAVDGLFCEEGTNDDVIALADSFCAVLRLRFPAGFISR